MMRNKRVWAVGGMLLAASGGCLQSTGGERNPFLTLTETLGVSDSSTDDDSSGGGGGVDTGDNFRTEMTFVFANNHPDATLNVNFVAWVNPNSIRSAEQQDALLIGGYVQLTRELKLGSVFTLSPGTFIFNGPGVAGATAVRLSPAAGGAPETTEQTLITPDAFLAFSQPPTSCDTVAFFYTVNDAPLDAIPVAGGTAPFEGATGAGGLKTFAQVDVYQCEPFRPGLFLERVRGRQTENEYFEGDSVRFDFFAVPNANGDAAVVTIVAPE